MLIMSYYKMNKTGAHGLLTKLNIFVSTWHESHQQGVHNKKKTTVKIG